MDINAILQSNNSKVNFLKGLIRVAKCDNVIDEKEFMFYEQAALAVGLGQEDIANLNNYAKSKEKLKISFDSSREKMFFLIQVIQLCWINGEYSGAEKTEVAQIAEELSISKNAVTEVEKWVEEGIIWNKRGDDLLSLQ